MTVHPTAIVEDGAELGDGVEIGPFCRVGPLAKLRDGVRLLSHVVIEGDTEIGAGSIVHPFAVLGGPPQHLRHKGEQTRLVVGEGAVIREQVTMNTGTVEGGGITRIGDRGLFMIGSHVAHDCNLGDNVICTNNVAVGGHAKIGNGVFLGALVGVHQYCRIGDFGFVGGCAAVTTDIIPYASAFGNHARLAGLNIIGMKRRGTPREIIHKLRCAYRELFISEQETFKDRLERVRNEYADCEEVRRIVEFIDEDASRPLMAPR